MKEIVQQYELLSEIQFNKKLGTHYMELKTLIPHGLAFDYVEKVMHKRFMESAESIIQRAKELEDAIRPFRESNNESKTNP